jgi:FixJ family two-component response regulator
MAASDFVVFVIDGEPAASASMATLVSSMGFECETFASAEQFLDAADLSRPGCVIVDLHLEGMGAFKLQERLVDFGSELSILFVGVNASTYEVVLAMRAGAYSVFEKPCIANELADAIRNVASIARHAHASHSRVKTLRTRFETLDPRERDVMTLVLTGVPNKTIARKLDVCQRTAAQIRADVFKKMDAKSGVDLATMTSDL